MKTTFRKRWYLFIPLIVIAFIAFGFITMQLWNWLMPAIFHLPLISFWQAIGLIILSRLLIGFGGHHNKCRSDYRNDLHEKWEKMTPEERAQFKDHVRLHRPPWMHRYPEEPKTGEA